MRLSVIAIVILFSPVTAIACGCANLEFFSETIRSEQYVFEAKMVCNFPDLELTERLHARFHVFRITRYWKGEYRDAEVVITSPYGTTCDVSFEKDVNYVFIGTPVGMIPGSRAVAFHVNGCTAFPYRYLPEAEREKIGEGYVMAAGQKAPLAVGPCGEYGRIEEELAAAKADQEKYGAMLNDRNDTAFKKILVKEAVLLLLLAVVLFRLSKRLNWPASVWIKAYLVSVTFTNSLMAMIVASGLIEYHNDTEFAGMHEGFTTQFAVGLVLVVLSTPSLIVRYRRKPTGPRAILLSFAALPFAFLVMVVVTTLTETFFGLSSIAALSLPTSYVLCLIVLVLRQLRQDKVGISTPGETVNA